MTDRKEFITTVVNKWVDSIGKGRKKTVMDIDGEWGFTSYYSSLLHDWAWDNGYRDLFIDNNSTDLLYIHEAVATRAAKYRSARLDSARGLKGHNANQQDR